MVGEVTMMQLAECPGILKRKDCRVWDDFNKVHALLGCAWNKTISDDRRTRTELPYHFVLWLIRHRNEESRFYNKES